MFFFFPFLSLFHGISCFSSFFVLFFSGPFMDGGSFFGKEEVLFFSFIFLVFCVFSIFFVLFYFFFSMFFFLLDFCLKKIVFLLLFFFSFLVSFFFSSFFVVIVLRFLGLFVVFCGVGEQPHSLPTEVGTSVLSVLTGTHPCDDPLRQDGEPSKRQLLLACLLVLWLLLS